MASPAHGSSLRLVRALTRRLALQVRLLPHTARVLRALSPPRAAWPCSSWSGQCRLVAACALLVAPARVAAGFSHAEPIYMVGDNADVDIRGANEAGEPWVSVLVRTGVFDGDGNHATHPADIVVDDVADAVAAVGHRERASRWHSMR
jgi:hypothetical protein